MCSVGLIMNPIIATTIHIQNQAILLVLVALWAHNSSIMGSLEPKLQFGLKLTNIIPCCLRTFALATSTLFLRFAHRWRRQMIHHETQTFQSMEAFLNHLGKKIAPAPTPTVNSLCLISTALDHSKVVCLFIYLWSVSLDWPGDLVGTGILPSP